MVQKPRACMKQALEVMRRTPPEQQTIQLHRAKCDYFTVDVVAGGHTGIADETSFVSLLITEEGPTGGGGETVQAKEGRQFLYHGGQRCLCFNGQLQSPADNRWIITSSDSRRTGLLRSRMTKCGLKMRQVLLQAPRLLHIGLTVPCRNHCCL